MTRLDGWRLCGRFGLAALLCLPAVREALESRMSLHMAVELPLWGAAGWLMGGAIGARARAWNIDAGGLLGATWASCVLALWMIPAALDLAILVPWIGACKAMLWLLAGAGLRGARGRMSPVVAVFFLGNAAWMTATAGLLYLDEEQGLCVNYLLDDQWVAGGALIGWSVAMGLLGLVGLMSWGQGTGADEAVHAESADAFAAADLPHAPIRRTAR